MSPLLAALLVVVVKSGPSCKPGAKGSVCVLVVAGSGGHTTEILRLMESLSLRYRPRHYVIADTDRMSEEKILSTLNALRYSVPLVFRLRPDVTLSLSGKILYPVADYFFVQWSTLRDKYPKSIFLGRIV
ncbi:hypothetical protein CRUP_033854 [Coryphaenoides rupestris]|nr:hypothetical protein CRUP_033854 [Coryphaenoides rupestris]